MPISTTSSSDKRKREADRARQAARRASLTSEERAAARAKHDRAYRAAHREQRAEYTRQWRKRNAE